MRCRSNGIRRMLPLVVSVALIGCQGTSALFHGVDHAIDAHYADVAVDIEYAPLPLDEEFVPRHFHAPRPIREIREDELWNLSLQETLHMAISNSRIIRSRAQFLSPANILLDNPNQVPSVFDPAIQNSGVLFGTRGVQAARADFDTQLTASMIWGRDELVQNNPFQSGGLPPGLTLVEESGVFSSRMQKSLLSGGTVAVNHNWNYSGNNAPARLFQSVYTGVLEAEYRQPLLAGFGSEFTRIAGPISRNIQGISGVTQGVLIARINSDISVADFESNVNDLLKDVEDTYWDLVLAYHTYRIERNARDKIEEVWQKIKAREAPRADEAQARDTYYETAARTEHSLADLYQVEAQLRRLLGLPASDGRMIHPTDRAIAAEYVLNWDVSLAEALTGRVELRRQKRNIQSLELQLTAARSLVKPRLDFVSNYRVNGFGDHLMANDDNDGITRQGFNSAYETIGQGRQTGWNLGVEMSMPLGLRAARSQVHNLELRLAKARTVLQEQELEISHELSNAFHEVQRWYRTAQTNDMRRQAAQERIDAFEASYEALPGQVIDPILRSQVSLSQARIQYYQSLIEYTKSISDVNYRKGTLLSSNNVAIAEGDWDFATYRRALEDAMLGSHETIAPDEAQDATEWVAAQLGHE